MAVIINGDAGVTTTSGAQYNSLQRGTAASPAIGSSIEFAIPSWARRITLILAGASTTGSATCIVRLGTASGVVTSGYVGGITVAGSSVSTANNTSGIGGFSTSAGATTVTGQFVISNVSGNIWVSNGMVYRNGETSSSYSNGFLDLGVSPLTSVALVVSGFFGAFDAGTVNVIYE